MTIAEACQAVGEAAGWPEGAGMAQVQTVEALWIAYEHLAQKAADNRSARLLRRIDLLPAAGEESVDLDPRVIATQSLHAEGDTRTPYTWINVPQAQQVDAYGWNGGEPVYWLEHRTIHFRPAAVEGARLVARGWEIPPMPTQQDYALEAPWPSRVTPWLIAKAVMCLNRPTPGEKQLERASKLLVYHEADVVSYLRSAVADVPPWATYGG